MGVTTSAGPRDDRQQAFRANTMATKTTPRAGAKPPRATTSTQSPAAMPPKAAAQLQESDLPGLPGLRTGDDVETRIYNTVYESVMTQRLTPGTKLPEASLCELFYVRRATVRKVLQALAQRPGFVKSRDQLMDVAYDDQVYVDDRTIDSHIKRLRKKFKQADDNFEAIETLYGVGYRFKES